MSTRDGESQTNPESGCRLTVTGATRHTRPSPEGDEPPSCGCPFGPLLLSAEGDYVRRCRLQANPPNPRRLDPSSRRVEGSGTT